MTRNQFLLHAHLMQTELYRHQTAGWPQAGRHILAQYDDESIVVYQAYRPAIGHYAAEHRCFGGEYSFSRMSWIKPNFLWMMYRSGWGTKSGQEVTLAIRIPRSLFDEMLETAVVSSYSDALYPDHAAWKRAVATSDVRLQWDPDHDPAGNRQERRAIQLGLRGEMLERFARSEVLDITDISGFVATQRAHISARNTLVTPRESVYTPRSERARRNIGLDEAGAGQDGRVE